MYLIGFLQLLGDVIHALAIGVIVVKIYKKESIAGFSGRTQNLYAFVLTSKVLAIFFSTFNLFWIIFGITHFIKLILTFYIIYYIYVKCKCVNHRKQDRFWAEILLLPAFILTAIYYGDPSPEFLCWRFGMYLEVATIIPQFYLEYIRGRGDRYVFAYIVGLILYQGFYLGNVAYQIWLNDQPLEKIQTSCNIIQFTLYFIYFAIPATAVTNTETAEPLPTTLPPRLAFLRQESLLETALIKGKMGKEPSDIQLFISQESPRSVRSMKFNSSTPKLNRSITAESSLSSQSDLIHFQSEQSSPISTSFKFNFTTLKRNPSRKVSGCCQTEHNLCEDDVIFFIGNETINKCRDNSFPRPSSIFDDNKERF